MNARLLDWKRAPHVPRSRSCSNYFLIFVINILRLFWRNLNVLCLALCFGLQSILICKDKGFQGGMCCQAGPFLGQPIGLFIYIYLSHASVRPVPSVAPAATLLSLPVSLSVSRWSTVNSSSCRRARSRARRWSIVALVNK